MSCNDNKSTQNQNTEKTCAKKELLSATAIAADAALTAVLSAKAFGAIVRKMGEKSADVLKAEALKPAFGAGVFSGMLLRGDFIPTLAQAIDRLWAKEQPIEEPVEEPIEEIVEEPVEEVAEAPVEEAVPVMAQAEESNEDADDDDGEDEGDSFAGLNMSDLDFIDVMAQPEEYAALLAQEQNGEIRIVTRYRRSFLSRLIQSQGDVQAYYSAIKNKLLSYKGVKGRVSWAQESFNKGRTYVAKVNAKSKTLYLYLALDPETVATLEDGKYNIIDVSDKKKYADVPVLMKIKGPRKLKHALELLDLVCRENLQLPDAKNFEETDYTIPYQSTEELVQAGSIKKFVAGIPMSDDVPAVAVAPAEENASAN